jgi:hypothetical protein
MRQQIYRKRGKKSCEVKTNHHTKMECVDLSHSRKEGRSRRLQIKLTLSYNGLEVIKFMTPRRAQW